MTGKFYLPDTRSQTCETAIDVSTCCEMSARAFLCMRGNETVPKYPNNTYLYFNCYCYETFLVESMKENTRDRNAFARHFLFTIAKISVAMVIAVV